LSLSPPALKRQCIGCVDIALLWGGISVILFKLSILALIFVAAAVATGLFFTLRGQDAIFSMGVAMSFISACTFYFAAYFVRGRMLTSENRATIS
jgi:hypothetical protein